MAACLMHSLPVVNAGEVLQLDLSQIPAGSCLNSLWYHACSWKCFILLAADAHAGMLLQGSCQGWQWFTECPQG